MTYRDSQQALAEWCEEVGGTFDAGTRAQIGGDRPIAECEFDGGEIEILGFPDGSDVAQMGLSIDSETVRSDAVYQSIEEVYTAGGDDVLHVSRGIDEPITFRDKDL